MRRYQIGVADERSDICRLVGIWGEAAFVGAFDARDHRFMNALAGFFSVPSRNTYAARECRQKSPHPGSRVEQIAHRSIDTFVQVFIVECQRPIAGLQACRGRLGGYPEKGGVRKAGVGMTAADIRMTSGKPRLFLLSGSGASAHTLPVRLAFMRVSNILLSKIRETTPSPGPLGHNDFVFEARAMWHSASRWLALRMGRGHAEFRFRSILLLKASISDATALGDTLVA